MSSSIADDFPAIQEPFLEFRAGKMRREGTRVVPDLRRGLVRIGRGEEGLIHFQWLDRTTNVIEDDQIIFPDEGVFEKVNQSSERVYILKFQTDDRKFFFWMQEPDSDNDMQICSAVNLFINQPMEFPGEEEPDASAPLQNSDDLTEDDISSRAGNLVGPSTGAELTSDVTSSGPVKLVDLQRILSNIGSTGFKSSIRVYCSSTSFTPIGTDLFFFIDEAADSDAGLGLGDILKPELILPLIETLSLEQGLASYLPEGQWSPEDLMEILQSPPFRQQVDSFTYVLRTGQIDLTQFGIDPSKYKFTVLSFLEALEDSVLKTSGSASQRMDDKDSMSQALNKNDPMDEGQ